VAGELSGEDPWRVHNAIIVLCDSERFWESLEQAPAEALLYGFQLGRGAAFVDLDVELPVGVDGALNYYRLRQEIAAKGGKATKKLSPDQEKTALKLIHEHSSLGVKKTPACVRAAAQLKKDDNGDVSKDTLLRLLRKRKQGNA
jgi:hypothetical protein